MEQFMDLANIAIVGTCVALGAGIKHLSPVANKYIPLTLAVTGGALGVAIAVTSGADVITGLMGGIISGGAAVGMHEIAVRTGEKTNTEKEGN